ncbi:unnamed protein product [Periconia digitata]|uniref:TRAF-type zinc finger protein n=1 Tax=Periconia digitata TaxID=1303443 RepID=A0A9W4U488_9PLEO|nr:unnamed protein product [Periconia digitata]
MSSPEPIPPPNDRRGSRASSNADISVQDGNGVMVGGPPGSPSPLQIRASNSLNSKNRRRPIAKQPPDVHLLEYCHTPDSNLVCLICHSPFDKPVKLLCDHYFCRQCLEHAWAAQQDGEKTCPTCRSKVDVDKDLRPVPRIIETMLDELVVKCPNSKSGCDWSDQRANVHDHVMLYCVYTLVQCPSYDCRLHISQKDFHKGCLHYTVSCENCHTSMMMKDLEGHQRTDCPGRSTNCPHCSAEVLRLDFQAHVKEACPKVVIPCSGAVLSCTFTAERAEVASHQETCVVAKLAPHFQEQQARIERSEARLEPLSRRVGILEDGLSNITSMLYPANSEPSLPLSEPLDPTSLEAFPPAHLTAASDFRLSPNPFPSVPQNDVPQTTQPPFDSQIHHLLTMHDSLREEVSRITNALGELDGRTNMMIINESQRQKDEMLHTNAAINSMRMQLHWLMSATLSNRNAAGSSTARASASTAAASGSANSATRGASASAGLGNRATASATLHAPLRRLSDSTRQDTKL